MRSKAPVKTVVMPLATAVRVQWASFLLMSAALLCVMLAHLIPALFSGLITFLLIRRFEVWLPARLGVSRIRVLAVVLLSTVVVGGLVALIVTAIHYANGQTGIVALMDRVVQILEDSSKSLPAWVVEYLPDSAEALRDATVAWVNQHSQELQAAGKGVGVVLAHILVGMVIGALVAVQDAVQHPQYRALALALHDRVGLFTESFRRIVSAQVRISALNTIFTGIYLAIVLPLLGVHLPLTKTMIAVTFIAGLLPVVGNLISNAVIVVVSFSYSPLAAAGALGFLVVIHKLEYFLNAKIVGSQINARAWELLLAMLVMESLFGILGVVAAPVVYAYIKAELVKAELI